MSSDKQGSTVQCMFKVREIQLDYIIATMKGIVSCSIRAFVETKYSDSLVANLKSRVKCKHVTSVDCSITFKLYLCHVSMYNCIICYC